MVVDSKYINRKDANPVETVEFILSLLKDNNFDVYLTEEKNHKDKWYSVRLMEKNSLPFSSNGKGITKEFAMASAYAEFMERLQGEFIAQQVLIKNEKMFFEKEEVVGFIRNKYISNLKCEEIEEILMNNRECMQKLDYYNLNKEIVESLPEWIVAKTCSSNGLCAGNTVEEAIVEGIGEILERYVKQYIFIKETKAPTIPKEFFKGLKSYDLLNEIEENGFECIVKDYTLNGRFPVLALVVLNKDRTKMIYTAGSDLDIDICLQRCITEMFQGRILGEDFEKYMCNIGYNIFFQEKMDIYSKKNLWKTIRDNTGVCPINILAYKEKNDYKFKEAFLNRGFTNKEALDHLKKLIKKENKEIYIRDHSYLGFKTYRVYIPGMSEIKKVDQVLLLREDRRILKEMIYSIDKLDEEKLRILCNVIEKRINSELTDLDGVIKGSIVEVNNIDMFDDNKFMALIYMYLKDYGNAYLQLVKYLKYNKNIYINNISKYNSVLIYLNGKLNGIEEKTLKNSMEFLGDNVDDDFRKIIETGNIKWIVENLSKCNNEEKYKLVNEKTYELYEKSKNYEQNNIVNYINKSKNM